jgi:serine/threonine protein kinase/Tfp pilus assembly protein PilF
MAVITANRWRALSPFLDQVLDLPPDERDGWVADLRLTDSVLAGELRRLLDEQEGLSRGRFLAGAPAHPPDLSVAGHRVGAYTLVSPIGHGGMGTVWLAERNDGRFVGKVAVKLLNLGLIGPVGETRFKREGTILARLRHAHIAHLIDAGVSEIGQPYLVLEHVEGEHIDQYCAHHALTVEARVRLFIDVLAAVAHAHANLIVHRDVKPSNVLVRTDGQVKLLDFGIAKLLDTGTDAASMAITAEGGRALTPEYAAPEQLTGGPITTATDVYALGTLLYVLLGGPLTAAARGGSAAELIKSIVETDPPRLSDVAPNGKSLRGDLDNIVAKALKKAPEERYPSVSAMADDLRRYLRHEPVSARPDTLTYRTATFIRRRARGVAVAAVVSVIVASLVGFYTVRLGAERDRARLEAGKSARISELLTSLLTASDPYATRDREPTVRNILDTGADRVARELRDQPAVKAEMMTVIGRVYQRLGVHDKAAPLLEEAVAIGRASGEETVQLAQSLNDLGVLRRGRGDAAAATPVLEEALAMRQELLGREHTDVAITLVELGRAYQDRGLLDRAEPLFREALTIRQTVLGDAHRETATSKSALALLLWTRGDIAAAEPLFRQSLATSRAALSDDHPNVASSWNNLGLVLLDKGDFVGAEPMFRQSLAIRRTHFGDSHASLAPSLSNLAASLREQGRYDEARSLLEEALSVTRQGLGDSHQSIPGLQVNLARVHLAQNDAVAAGQLARDALGRQRRTLAHGDWRLAATASVLGASLLELGDYRAAEPLLIEAHNVLRDVPGRQGREAAATRARLGALYRALGRPDDAELYSEGRLKAAPTSGPFTSGPFTSGPFTSGPFTSASYASDR